MLMPKDIIKEDHPTLRLIAEDVKIPLTKKDLKLVNDLMDYVENSQDPEISEKYEMRPGVGLAAPQINVSKKITAIKTYDEDGNLYKFALINPKIYSHSTEMTYLPTGEGCLSVDRDVPGFVPRYKKITFKGYLYDFSDNTLKEGRFTFKNYLAVVTQHEYDHLMGKLFFDRIDEENPYKPIDNSVPVIFPTNEDEEEDE